MIGDCRPADPTKVIYQIPDNMICKGCWRNPKNCVCDLP